MSAFARVVTSPSFLSSDISFNNLLIIFPLLVLGRSAVEWWEKNSNKWKMVRDKWNTIYGLNQDLALKPAVDDKKLYSYLFSPAVVEKGEIESTIDMFLI